MIFRDFQNCSYNSFRLMWYIRYLNECIDKFVKSFNYSVHILMHLVHYCVMKCKCVPGISLILLFFKISVHLEAIPPLKYYS